MLLDKVVVDGQLPLMTQKKGQAQDMGLTRLEPHPVSCKTHKKKSAGVKEPVPQPWCRNTNYICQFLVKNIPWYDTYDSQEMAGQPYKISLPKQLKDYTLLHIKKYCEQKQCIEKNSGTKKES